MQQYDWQFSAEGVDWYELSVLYKRAPLGDKQAADLQTVFTNSRYQCFVYSGSQLIGVGRCLADGLDCSYICDVAVLPEYQGRGLGKTIVAKLVELSRGHKKIILYAVPGKEGFYHKLGFKRMNTALAIFENEQQAMAWGLLGEI